MLAGCSALLETARQKDSRMIQSSYAAADMLAQQSKNFLTPQTPLEIGVIAALDNPNEKTDFGGMVAEQVASRKPKRNPFSISDYRAIST